MVEVLQAAPTAAWSPARSSPTANAEIIDNVGHSATATAPSGGGDGWRWTGASTTGRKRSWPPAAAPSWSVESALDQASVSSTRILHLRRRRRSLRSASGWPVVGGYVPSAVVYHKYSATTGAYSPFKAFLVERNRIWLTIKCFPPGALLLRPFFAVWRIFLQVYGVAAGKGRPDA